MALPRALLVVSLLLILLSPRLAHSRRVTSGGSQLVFRSERSLQVTIVDCAGACDARCSRSWKPKMCKKTCGACCSRCNCVPAGTGVETRASCPCYTGMKNPKGKLKCP